ncbi:MAG: hypothetical protein NTV79_00300, partial [Candidatus Aureabacteria bacterium]|nr:hypothetical protein [Candidatus Auribacterota bacterium]
MWGSNESERSDVYHILAFRLILIVPMFTFPAIVYGECYRPRKGRRILSLWPSMIVTGAAAILNLIAGVNRKPSDVLDFGGLLFMALAVYWAASNGIDIALQTALSRLKKRHNENHNLTEPHGGEYSPSACASAETHTMT